MKSSHTLTFADKVIRFNRKLIYTEPLSGDIQVMNPFRCNEEINVISREFYKKYYDDYVSRYFILGINPGRLGAGVTGVPFTDTKRLLDSCGIKVESVSSHEISSVFVYDVINRYGGAEKFFSKFYIHSLFPLALIRKNNRGKWVNFNFYDSMEVFRQLKHFIINNLKQQIKFGIYTNHCYILGRKNALFFEKINKEEKLFDSYTVLDHPRYIEQYQGKNREAFICDYLDKLNRV